MNKRDLKAIRKASREQALKEGTYFLYKSKTIPDKKKQKNRDSCRKYKGERYEISKSAVVGRFI